MAPEIEEETIVRKAVGEHVELRIHRAVVEDALHQVGQTTQLVADLRHLLGAEVAAHGSEMQRQQCHQCDLRGERLACRDADLEAGAGVEHAICGPGHSGTHDVGDCDNACSALASDLHRSERVGRLARLRDRDHERLRIEDTVAIAPLAGHVGLGRNPTPVLDQVAADKPGVQGRATANDQNAIYPTQLVVGQADAVEVQLTVEKPLRNRVSDGRGLLMDLLQHEGLIATLGSDL